MHEEPPVVFTIVPYTQRYRQAFYDINRAWLDKYFRVEPIDEEVLSKPEEYILNKGGRVLMGLENYAPVGTVALMMDGQDLELTKMGVLEFVQGKGYGKKLLYAALDEARHMGYDKVVLYSNSRLDRALDMYRRAGFKEVPVNCDKYERCDVKMELKLD